MALAMQPYSPGQPQPKKGIGALGIVLIFVGLLFVGALGTCVAGYFWVKGKAEAVVNEIGEAGGKLVLVAPDEVKAALAGDKKDYVGHWSSKKGSTLTIDPTGNLLYEKDEDGDGVKEKLQAPIAAFAGDDIQCQAFLTFTVHVTSTPKLEAGKWRMVVDGIEMER
jgi:hypothetical protein